ncbi:unnamed protein product, partial [Chrysoparadoxa australica]
VAPRVRRREISLTMSYSPQQQPVYMVASPPGGVQQVVMVTSPQQGMVIGQQSPPQPAMVIQQSPPQPAAVIQQQATPPLSPHARAAATAGSAPVICKERVMLSRTRYDGIHITDQLKPGQTTGNCIQCCNAPEWFRCCSVLPCCGDPKYIIVQREASKYIYVRENGIEYNRPTFTADHGACCGVSLCRFRLVDDIKTVYFDDITFDSVQEKTRMCNDCLTAVCGGHGERV